MAVRANDLDWRVGTNPPVPSEKTPRGTTSAFAALEVWPNCTGAQQHLQFHTLASCCTQGRQGRHARAGSCVDVSQTAGGWYTRPPEEAHGTGERQLLSATNADAAYQPWRSENMSGGRSLEDLHASHLPFERSAVPVIVPIRSSHGTLVRESAETV